MTTLLIKIWNVLDLYRYVTIQVFEFKHCLYKLLRHFHYVENINEKMVKFFLSIFTDCDLIYVEKLSDD